MSGIAKPGSVNRASKWRGTDDHYPTPEGATWALCNAVDLPASVWEPACGDGAVGLVAYERLWPKARAA